MITPEEKARIARENGAKSQGPTSPEGKERVSQNSIRHGFFSKRIIIPGESEATYAKLAEAYLEFLKPETLVEIDLVTDMINSRWLIRRAEQLSTTAYWAAQDKLKAESDSYADQSPDRLQYACFQQAIEGKNYLEILATMKEKHERGYHRAVSRLERLRRRKQPLPDMSPHEIEKEFPDNGTPKPSPEPQPTTSTNVEIEQANQHEASPPTANQKQESHEPFSICRWLLSFAKYGDGCVGRAPSPAADPPVGLRLSNTRSSIFHCYADPNSRSSSVLWPYRFFAAH